MSVTGQISAICPKCGAPASPGHRFCEQCGANLRWAGVACIACGVIDIGDDGFCRQCGRAQPTDRDRVELAAELAGTQLAGGVSDRGRRRRRNEDAMACGHAMRGDGPGVVAVVCDGVASVQRGDEAAQAAAHAASAALLSAVGDGSDVRQATSDAVHAAAAAVNALAHAGHGNGATGPSDSYRAGAPSSTYVSAVVIADQVVVGWVGDSRAYWLGDQSRRLTTDHAFGGVLTRWLGADAGEVVPQVMVFRPDGAGVVVVCSDGLWNYLPEPDQLAAVALPTGRERPLTAAAELTRRALDAGGRDNITVVVVPYPPHLPPEAQPQAQPQAQSQARSQVPPEQGTARDRAR
ncbi:MAG TPA: protein phosphatase 2C domain-containing protein [Pseudonocardiaceae bacterium]|jgi:serine/threonine protein phosphatase PrpC